jgi:hypothetical protein
MTDESLVILALRAAGAGQILLGVMPAVAARPLRWAEESARMRPMNARMFRTLICYISGINIAFGLLGLLAPRVLIDGSPLATLVLAFITLYWVVRLVLQLAYYRWREVGGWLGSAPARHGLTAGLCCFVAAHGLALLYVAQASGARP